jgi:hypothetical protein
MTHWISVSEFAMDPEKFVVTKSKSWKPEEAWQKQKLCRLSSFWLFLFDWLFKPVEGISLFGRRTEVVPHILGVSHLLDKIGDGDKESKPRKHNGVRLLRRIAQNPALEGIYESEALQCLIEHLWAELVSITPVWCVFGCLVTFFVKIMQHGFRFALIESIFFVTKLVVYVVWAMSVKRKSPAWQSNWDYEDQGQNPDVYAMLPVDANGFIAGVEQTRPTAEIMAVLVVVHTCFELWHEYDLLNQEICFLSRVQTTTRFSLRQCLQRRHAWMYGATRIYLKQVAGSCVFCGCHTRIDFFGTQAISLFCSRSGTSAHGFT